MRLKFPDVERPKILTASQASLWKPEGAPALEYLRTQRHLSDRVIKEFQIGYCPRQVDHELAGRIIMPICDAYGKLVAFTSRDVEAPKRFQHWHEQFDKSNYLYGMHIAKEHIRRTDKAIIVEGQFDVTYAHTVGLNMTVGLCGTAFSIMQVGLLSRYCSEIYPILDPDSAGDSAIERMMDMYYQYCLSSYGMRFFPVSLPDDLDPDEFLLKHGVQGMTTIMKESKARILNG